MTEASSCKQNYFGAYLRYRLGRMKTFLIVGLILNFVVLPLEGLMMIIRVNRLYSLNVTHSVIALNYTAMVYITIISTFAVIIGLAFTMVCAVSSYSYFCKKETVDTLGVLAVTYKQRFWGDFLGGFIPTLGTFIPCALIGILFASIAQNKLNAFAINDKYVNIMPFFIGLTLTLFFAYLFIYLLTTLAAMCCGRSSSMIIFTVISFAAIPVFVISLTKLITLEAVGMKDTLVSQVQQLCMPAGLFFSNVSKALEMMIDEHNQNLLFQLSELKFAVNSPISIVILIIAAIMILALAYLAGKDRKQENVGRMFVRTGYFHAIMITMSAGGFFITACILRNTNPTLMIPIGLIVSVVVAVVFEVIRRPRVRQLPMSVARWVITAACSVGFVILLGATGSFGSINIPKDVQSVRIEFYDNSGTRRELELTERAEITEFLDAHNKSINNLSRFMKSPDDAHFTSGFAVSYITAAGGYEEIRGYINNDYGYDRKVTTVDTLSKNILSLSFYSRKSAELLSGNAVTAEAVIPEIFNKVSVPSERLSEFTQTLKQDILDNYDANADPIGNATVGFDDSSVSYPIQNIYENTIRLIREYNNSVEKDPNAEVMTVDCSLSKEVPNGYNRTYWKDVFSVTATIRERDMKNPKVKELLGLLKVGDSSEEYRNKTIRIIISSKNGIRYYIPDDDKIQAVKLIAQIAAESVQ